MLLQTSHAATGLVLALAAAACSGGGGGSTGITSGNTGGATTAGVTTAGTTASGTTTAGTTASGTTAGTTGGGTSFTGTYLGSLNQSASTCSDGSMSAASTNQGTLTLSQPSATEVDIVSMGNCPNIPGVLSGSTVTIQPVTCPAQASGGNMVVLSITGGTLTLSGSTLMVTLHTSERITLASGAGGTCTPDLTGSLTKQ